MVLQRIRACLCKFSLEYKFRHHKMLLQIQIVQEESDVFILVIMQDCHFVIALIPILQAPFQRVHSRLIPGHDFRFRFGFVFALKNIIRTLCFGEERCLTQPEHQDSSSVLIHYVFCSPETLLKRLMKLRDPTQMNQRSESEHLIERINELDAQLHDSVD